MKKILTTLAVVLLALAANAQNDTTSTVVGEKLNFEEPQFLTSTYFETVKAHLSPEWRKSWKPEFSVRANVMIYYGSIDITGGIRTSPNKVFGLGVGRGKAFIDANPAHAYRLTFYLYHRHYIPFDRSRRISLYSDIMGGGMYTYKVTGHIIDGRPQLGELRWYFLWEPGLSIRLWGKSNIFLGPSLGSNFGVHLGLAI